MDYQLTVFIDLLVRGCDEFVYLETVLGETGDEDVQSSSEREMARNTLRKALQAHGRRGEFPVLAARLKQMNQFELPDQGDSVLSPTQPSLDVQYRQLFARLKMTNADFSSHKDVLRDIYLALSERPGQLTTDELLDLLRDRYAGQDSIRSKPMLREIPQMGYR